MDNDFKKNDPSMTPLARSCDSLPDAELAAISGAGVASTVGRWVWNGIKWIFVAAGMGAAEEAGKEAYKRARGGGVGGGRAKE